MNIPRRAIDIRPVIGAIVVFTIIGAAVYGAYYFVVAKPAAEELERVKLSALGRIDALAAVGTAQTSSAALSYSDQVRAAGSESEVESILVRVDVTAELERKRKELLDEVESATNGIFYSATGGSSTKAIPALATLSEALKAEINAKRTKSELEKYEPEIQSQATSTWRAHFVALIENIRGKDNTIAMFDSIHSGGYMSKENGLAYVRRERWETLRKLKFEEASTVEVPVLDTFQRSPTLKPDSVVHIYVYDIRTDNMSELWKNAKVRDVIYSQTDIATIAWTLVDGTTTEGYSVDMWETIKAAAAGDPEAALVGWSGYGANLMERALAANIGSYLVSVIYMVEVPDRIGELIMQYELHMTATKDVILIATV